MKAVILLALILAVSLAFAYITAAAINYVFGAAFLTFVFGGVLTFWKAFVLNLLIGLRFSGSSKD